MPQETVIDHPENFSSPDSPPGTPRTVPAEREVNLIDVTALLLREKKTILRFVVVTVVLAVIAVFLVLKPMYTGEAVFLPPQSSPGSGLAQLATQLGSLGAVGALTGMKSPGEVYVGILESRTIADTLIKQFDLQKVYKTNKLSDTLKKLKRRSTFTSAKNTLITISVADHDPKRAADMANAYLDALREQNGRLALSDASQRRLFFQEQLEREKNALADAEVDLKKTQEQTGLIAPVGQAQMEIEATAQLRAQIASDEVSLESMKQGATEQNPQVVRLQTEIAGLQGQLKKMQSDPSRREPGTVQLPTAKVPELALEYVRKQREVKYHEALFEMLAKQYEAARLDESREAPLLQVIDRAVVPDERSGPPGTLIIAGAFVFGTLAGIAWVILKRFLKALREHLNAAKTLGSRPDPLA